MKRAIRQSSYTLGIPMAPMPVIRLSASEVKTLQAARSIAEHIRELLPKEGAGIHADALDQDTDTRVAGIELGVNYILERNDAQNIGDIDLE